MTLRRALMGSDTFAGSFTRAEAETALRISGVQGTAIVERHKPMTDTRYCVGIRYQKFSDIVPLSISFETVLGERRWDELMKVIQVDQTGSSRVAYFPGRLLDEDPADGS